MDKEILERAIKGNDMCREKYNCSECPYHGLHYCHSILCRESRDLLKEIVMCKDCKDYEQKEHWANFGGVPILATEMPTCSKWADGDCATRPDGYCFLAERRDSP